MFNFFVDAKARNQNSFVISGQDYKHIKNVLRMNEGDTLLVSCDGVSHLCRIEEFMGESAIVEIVEENYKDSELKIKLYLIQGLPKSDKMELIIQKAVELGVWAVVPVEMNRCVVKLDPKKKKSKTERWQAIAESAAKQSKRNVVPEIYMPMSYNDALKLASSLDVTLIPYENVRGMTATKEALKGLKKGQSVGIFIGPEGGFEESEIERAIKLGGQTISLGERILRTETAAITAVGMCMLYTEMNLTGEEKV